MKVLIKGEVDEVRETGRIKGKRVEKGEETEAELELWWSGGERRRNGGGRKAERGAQGWQPR